MSTLKKLLMGISLITAIGLTTWSLLLSQPKKFGPNSLLMLMDSYMEEAVAVILNEEGKPTLKIETPHMIHYTNNNTTKLLKPRVTIFKNSPTPWHVTADYAQLTDGIEQIVFKDHVVIQHPSDIHNPMTTMTTTSLIVFPRKQTAETSSAITITQPDIVVNAVGMFANLQDGTIKLLSQARGEYAPHS